MELVLEGGPAVEVEVELDGAVDGDFRPQASPPCSIRTLHCCCCEDRPVWVLRMMGWLRSALVVVAQHQHVGEGSRQHPHEHQHTSPGEGGREDAQFTLHY
jgi:hypothetical protein